VRCYLLSSTLAKGPYWIPENSNLACVEAIAGQTRMELVFDRILPAMLGTTPSHAATSLAQPAEWAIAVDKKPSRFLGLVATVGALEAQPGAP